MRCIQLSLFFLLLVKQTVWAQDTTALKSMLLGRWEVIKYAEQGIQVDKKQAADVQAQKVYQFVATQRARLFYGYDPEGNERQTRAFERWVEADRLQETTRITKAIATPYFAVFFADSTLACYNKDTSGVLFPESRHFIFAPGTMSMDISYPGGTGVQWQAQVLVLTRERMVLFLPEDAEIVELIRTSDSLP